MKQVFSRWPSEAQPAASSEAIDPPQWMRSRPGGMHVPLIEAGGLVLAIAILFFSVFLLPVALQGWHLVSVASVLVVATALLGAGLWRMSRDARRLEREHADLRAWSETLFEKASVALWREDWSAARDEVERLLRSGVTDIQAYYTERPDALRRLRSQIVIKGVNPIALERMGASSESELLGSLDRILPDTEHTFVQWLVAFARGDRLYRSETHLTRPDGTITDTLFSASIPTDREGFRDILVVDFDITAYKAAQSRLVEMERDLIRASRITTMGALTATIAHEVNSPLAAIISHAEASLRWLNRRTPDLDEARTALSHVVSDATRARDVVTRTRSYLANAPSGTTEHDLVRTVRDAFALIERELRQHEVALHFDADENLPPILGDPIQLQQVVVNLMLNAAEAMRDTPAPKDLTVTVRREAERIVVRVRDRGVGLDEVMAERVFEPFYSTRDQGIGMGLAICRTVVEAHGGRIWAAPAPDEGATFQFALPVAHRQAEGQ